MVVEHQAVHFTNVHFENCCLYVKAGASAKLTDTHFTMSEDSSVGVSLLLVGGNVNISHCTIKGGCHGVYMTGEGSSMHAEHLTCIEVYRSLELTSHATLTLERSSMHGQTLEGGMAVALMALGCQCSIEDSTISANAGMLVCGGGLKMRRCSVQQCLSHGLVLLGSDALLHDIDIVGCGIGLALSNTACSAAVSFCRFEGNTSSDATVVRQAHVHLDRCVFGVQTSVGIAVCEGGEATVKQCTIRRNSSDALHTVEGPANGLVGVSNGCLNVQDSEMSTYCQCVSVSGSAAHVLLERCSMHSSDGCAVIISNNCTCTVLDSNVEGEMFSCSVVGGASLTMHDSRLHGALGGVTARAGGCLKLHDCNVRGGQEALVVHGLGTTTEVTGGTVHGGTCGSRVSNGAVLEMSGLHACGNGVSFLSAHRAVGRLHACVSDNAAACAYMRLHGGQLFTSGCVPDDKSLPECV